MYLQFLQFFILRNTSLWLQFKKGVLRKTFVEMLKCHCKISTMLRKICRIVFWCPLFQNSMHACKAWCRFQNSNLILFCERGKRFKKGFREVFVNKTA